jgi:hypothetical protein
MMYFEYAISHDKWGMGRLHDCTMFHTASFKPSSSNEYFRWYLFLTESKHRVTDFRICYDALYRFLFNIDRHNYSPPPPFYAVLHIRVQQHFMSQKKMCYTVPLTHEQQEQFTTEAQRFWTWTLLKTLWYVWLRLQKYSVIVNMGIKLAGISSNAEYLIWQPLARVPHSNGRPL